MNLIAEISTESSENVIILGASICILSLLTLAHCVLCKIGADLGKELTALHIRRIERVRKALASADSVGWTAVDNSPSFPFSGYVELLPDGIIRAAGQEFNTEVGFVITATDGRNIPRAIVTSNAKGVVLIQSHGQKYVCRFHEHRWDIRLEPSASERIAVQNISDRIHPE